MPKQRSVAAMRSVGSVADVRVPDEALDQLAEQGFTIVEGFLAPEELRDAQTGLWEHYPRPDKWFDDPAAHASFAASQFAGLRQFPWRSWALNRLAFHPDLVDMAARFLGSDDLRLYKAELWAKYAGAVDYDQHHHRDFGNHSLVVPKLADAPRQMTSFILLSDVTEADGPTKVVPRALGDTIPISHRHHVDDAFLRAHEISVTGPAGTLFTYVTDVLHRGSAITGPRSARFALLADFEVWGPRWTGKIAWPERSLSGDWTAAMEQATPRERALFGFPLPGDAYWDEQTRRDVGRRYPGMDMAPYSSPR